MIDMLKIFGQIWLIISTGTLMFTGIVAMLAFQNTDEEERKKQGVTGIAIVVAAVVIASLFFPLAWKWITEGIKENK